MAHKKHPFYVVRKSDGAVMSGWDYREDAVEAYRHPGEWDARTSMEDSAVMTHAGVKRKYGQVKWASSRARKNFAFLLPLLPLAAPIFVGGAGLAAAYYLKDTSAGPLIPTGAVVGGGLGYVAAGVTKQSLGVRLAAAAAGYGIGLLIHNYVFKKTEEKAKVEAEAKAEVKAAEDANWWKDWCAKHSTLAYITPQCYTV